MKDSDVTSDSLVIYEAEVKVCMHMLGILDLAILAVVEWFDVLFRCLLLILFKFCR